MFLQGTFRKFDGRYGDLIKQYEVNLSRMLHFILEDDHIQEHPLMITPIYELVMEMDLITETLHEVFKEDLQRVWYANTGRIPFHAPCPVQHLF